MKKNLLSILILALLLVNVVLTAITMFSVTSTNKKTAALVSDIASIIKLELPETSGDDEAAKEEVSMADTEGYDILEHIVPLKKDDDGKDKYAVVSIVLSMNTKNKDYEIYKEKMEMVASQVKGVITDVFSSHTVEEIKADPDGIQQELLSRVQTLFDSEFIYRITVTQVLYQ